MINNCEDLAKWCDGAEDEFGDPSIPVCQIFVRWMDPLTLYRGTDLVAGMMEGDLFLKLHPHIGPAADPARAIRVQACDEWRLRHDAVAEHPGRAAWVCRALRCARSSEAAMGEPGGPRHFSVGITSTAKLRWAHGVEANLGRTETLRRAQP